MLWAFVFRVKGDRGEVEVAAVRVPTPPSPGLLPTKRPATPTECLLNARLLKPKANSAHAASQYVCVFRGKGVRGQVEVDTP